MIGRSALQSSCHCRTSGTASLVLCLTDGAPRFNPAPCAVTSDTESLGQPDRDPVVIAASDARWPQRFEALRDRLAAALGEAALRIDHIGSTAVAELPAKPVIDIQISVRNVDDEAAYRAAIESLDYELRVREPEHRLFRPPSDSERTVHIHVCSYGSSWERRHLLFVAYLRAHADRAAQYAQLKRELAERFRTDRIQYTNAKDGFIAQTLVLAEEWARETGWGP